MPEVSTGSKWLRVTEQHHSPGQCRTCLAAGDKSWHPEGWLCVLSDAGEAGTFYCQAHWNQRLTENAPA